MRLIRYSFVVLVALLWSSAARAQLSPGVYLAWDGVATRNDVFDKTFDCSASAGSDMLVCSFMPNIDLVGVTSITADIRIRDPYVMYPSAGVQLTPWWRMDPAGCRAGAYQFSTEFSGPPFDTTPDVVDVVSGSIAIARYQWPAPGPDSSSALLHVEMILPATTFTAGQMYYVFRVTFPHTKAQGGGACEGCCKPMYLYMNDFYLDPPPGGTYALSGSSALTWQYQNFADCDAVPVHASSWGSLKTRYR